MTVRMTILRGAGVNGATAADPRKHPVRRGGWRSGFAMAQVKSKARINAGSVT
jgi:hypothetical protein